MNANKPKPRIFLNSIEVRSAADPELLREYYSEDCSDLKERLKDQLANLISLPRVAAVANLEAGDLGLDILVPRCETVIRVYDTRYRLFHFDPFWRPQLTILARMFLLASGRTISKISVTEKMRWEDYRPRALSLRSLFAFRSVTLDDDLGKMVSLGCLEIVNRLRKETGVSGGA